MDTKAGSVSVSAPTTTKQGVGNYWGGVHTRTLFSKNSKVEVGWGPQRLCNDHLHGQHKALTGYGVPIGGYFWIISTPSMFFATELCCAIHVNHPQPLVKSVAMQESLQWHHQTPLRVCKLSLLSTQGDCQQFVPLLSWWKSCHAYSTWQWQIWGMKPDGTVHVFCPSHQLVGSTIYNTQKYETVLVNTVVKQPEREVYWSSLHAGHLAHHIQDNIRIFSYSNYMKNVEGDMMHAPMYYFQGWHCSCWGYFGWKPKVLEGQDDQTKENSLYSRLLL